jgi:hypothetical protein
VRTPGALRVALARFGLGFVASLGVGTLVVAVASIAIAGSTFSGERPYAGQAGKGTTVAFQVQMRQRVPTRASFEAKDIELSCDDGTSPRVDFQPTTFRFSDTKVFAGDRYFLIDGNQEYYRVRGRLYGDGRAQGYLFYLADSLDPPRPRNPEMPDCSTFGKDSWNAERVRNR